MATPKGMRAFPLPVNATDAVHVYSDDHHIWLQLRRTIATENDVGKPSFKVAICLTPGTAHKLGLELLNITSGPTPLLHSLGDCRVCKLGFQIPLKLCPRNQLSRGDPNAP